MQSVVGMALLVVGVVLIVFGMQASTSLGSRFSEFFTGAPDHLAPAGWRRSGHYRTWPAARRTA